MRFWLKIGFLTFMGYLACYGSLLAQDRREHHEVIREVEQVTRNVILVDLTADKREEAQQELSEARRRLDSAEARWQNDAHHLLLLSTAE